MKYIDILKLYENKDSRINKLDVLTDEQKEEVKAFFHKHPEQESKIDWNNPSALTYENFKNVIDNFNNRNTLSKQKKIANKQGISGLTEGVDYEYLGEFNTKDLGTFRAYIPLSWLGAKTIAGKQVQPVNKDKDSAAWCIGYSKTDSYWNDYFLKRESSFVIICGEGVPTKKVCFEVMITYESPQEGLTCWDYYDKAYSFGDFFYKYSNIKRKDVIGADIYRVLEKFFHKAKGLSDEKRLEIKKEEEEREKKFEAYKTRFAFKGSVFPFFRVGERPEGKVFMSKYLTNIYVPFSPSYFGDEYKWGCNHWDISIIRQWLNSDAPAGEWYQEYEVDGYKVDWDSTRGYVKSFIKDTPGFLRLVGLSKSDLNPVTNITYTTDGKTIETVDYVWIPSLSELSTKNGGRNEGKPLEYWKTVLGKNASQDGNERRAMGAYSSYGKVDYYWTRSVDIRYSGTVEIVKSSGTISEGYARFGCKTSVLVCFK